MLLYSSGDAGLPMEWSTEQSIDNRTECENTLAALDDQPLYCPPLSEEYMHDCLAFLVERGLLAAPAKPVARTG
jgi:hypothetical protein